jgi:hypothetical protein
MYIRAYGHTVSGRDRVIPKLQTGANTLIHPAKYTIRLKNCSIKGQITVQLVCKKKLKNPYRVLKKVSKTLIYNMFHIQTINNKQNIS